LQQKAYKKFSIHGAEIDLQLSEHLELVYYNCLTKVVQLLNTKFDSTCFEKILGIIYKEIECFQDLVEKQ